MKLELITQANTDKELNDLINLQYSYLQEYDQDSRNMLKIDNSEYANTYYFLSTLYNGNIYRNWFTYTEDFQKYGLLIRESGRDKLEVYSEAKYIQYIVLWHDIVLARNSNGTFDLILNRNIIVSSIIQVEEMGIESKYGIYIMKFNRYSNFVVCIDYFDVNGVFIPRNENDFREWFIDILRLNGMNGFYDDYPLSIYVNNYYDIISKAFMDIDYIDLYESLEKGEL